MMWKTLDPNISDDSEPPELQKLKYQLANLTCKCSTCTRESPSNQSHSEKEVQVEKKLPSIDRFIQVTWSPVFPETSLHYPVKELCPSCFVTLNLLRGGMTKVMKDEELETKREMFTCDKGTKKTVKNAEKSTSFHNNPIPVHSNVTFCDFITECSSEISETERKKSCHQERVKFLSPTKDEVDQTTMPIYGECFCLENFMNSIRTPLI